MQQVDPKDYLQINKRHWDALAVEKWHEMKTELPHIVQDPDSCLERWEPHMFPYLRHIKGTRVIVLQFGDAAMVLACAKKGAEVTGVDLSSEQIRLAKKAAKFCRVNVKLVKADCQNLPDSIPQSYYDLAIAECGIFIWIADLDAWMRNAYKVLKRGGKLLAQDFHPLYHCIKKEGEVINIKRSYFDQTPEVYYPKEKVPPGITFTWKTSDVINAAIDAGFQVDHLVEFYDGPKEGLDLIPNKYFFAATKK